MLGYVCTVKLGWTVDFRWLILPVSVCLCSMLLCYGGFRNRAAAVYQKLFLGFTLTFFGSVGYLLSVRSHQQALVTYGEGFRYAIYQRNQFQNTKALALQGRLHKAFADRMPDGNSHKEEQAVIEAMTIGYKQGLTKDVRQRFSRAGISHLLAISGYHIGILFFLLHILTSCISRKIGWRRWSRFLSLFVLWGYAFITGMSPSVVRAVIMFTFVTFGLMLERDVKLLHSCTFAAFVILAIDPMLISHVGFQLSFCSVAGIALNEKWLKEGFQTGQLYGYTVGGLKVSLICTLATFPLVAYHFGTVSVWGLAGNLAALFLAPPLMLLTGVWWLLYALSIHAAWAMPLLTGVGTALQWVTGCLTSVASLIEGWPLATLSYRPGVVEVAMWYGVLLGGMALSNRVTGRRAIVWLCAVEGLLLALIARKTELGFGFLKD